MRINKGLLATAIVAITLSVTSCSDDEEIEETGSLARGFNDDINWMNIKNGYERAKEENKPMMVLIHKTWCGACKQLKPHFTTSMEIVKKSEQFVMINVEDNEENDLDSKFAKHGKYIPRIMFAEPDGTLRADIKNEKGNDKYPHYFTDAQSVVVAMNKALRVISGFERDEGEL